jgi:hypothetical protein
MTTITPVQNSLSSAVYFGDAGTGDNDVLIDAGGIAEFDTFMLSVGAGVVDVIVHDGKNWLTDPLSLGDLGADAAVSVLEATALRQFCFRGNFNRIRVLQKGATSATDSVLRCFRLS